MRKAYSIVKFEGPTGCGKSTILKIVKDLLEKSGFDCEPVPLSNREKAFHPHQLLISKKVK